MFSRLLYGARVDLRVAFLAVLFPFFLGTTLGCIAGYYGRFIDTAIMRLVDVVVAFPFYVLIIALVFVLGPGARSIYIAITLVGWVSYARIIRGEILVAKRQEYVLAAQAAGFRDGRIILRHLLPNVITQAIVFAMSDIVLDILAIVTLGYLGLGIQPPTPDWGGDDRRRPGVPDDQVGALHDPRRRGGHHRARALADRRRAGRPAAARMSDAAILEVRDLRVEIPLSRGTVHAVDGATLRARSRASRSGSSASRAAARA